MYHRYHNFVHMRNIMSFFKSLAVTSTGYVLLSDCQIPAKVLERNFMVYVAFSLRFVNSERSDDNR